MLRDCQSPGSLPARCQGLCAALRQPPGDCVKTCGTSESGLQRPDVLLREYASAVTTRMRVRQLGRSFALGHGETVVTWDFRGVFGLSEERSGIGGAAEKGWVDVSRGETRLCSSPKNLF